MKKKGTKFLIALNIALFITLILVSCAPPDFDADATAREDEESKYGMLLYVGHHYGRDVNRCSFDIEADVLTCVGDSVYTIYHPVNVFVID